MAPFSSAEIMTMLRTAGLRPTRQRVALGRLMYGDGNRHLSAESLHAEAIAAGIQVSLATIYNTLNQFTGAGLLQEAALEGS
jgi:Fur family transcriptional regulator, iron response regulator